MANNSGLNALAEQLKKQKVLLAAYVALVATAENKWRAVGSIVKEIAIWKMIGPLGIVLGSMKGIEGAVRSILRDTGSLLRVLERMAQIQGLERQFRGIMGSAAAARSRVAELLKVLERGGGRFSLGDLGATSRELEILTRGGYAGAAAMERLQDAAVGTGAALGDVGGATGEFYRALLDGQPVDAAVSRLVAMGVVSESAGGRLRELQRSGAALQSVINALDAELAKHKGALDAWKGGVEGVEAAFARAQDALGAGFAEPFKESELARLRDVTAVLVAMGPAVKMLGGWLSGLTGGLRDVGTRAGSWLDKLGALEPAVMGVAMTLRVLVNGLLVLGVALGVRAVAGFAGALVRMMVTARAAGTAMTAFRGAALAANGAVVQLRAGNLAAAGSQAALAGASLRSAVALGTMAAATRLASLALKGLLYASGIGILVALLGVLAEAVGEWAGEADRAAEAQRELATANNEVVSALQRQIAEIRNLDDAQAALTATTKELMTAQERLQKLRAGDKNMWGQRRVDEVAVAIQQGHVNALRGRMGQIQGGMNRGVYGVTEQEAAAGDARARREVELERMQRADAVDRADGLEKVRLLEEELLLVQGLGTEYEVMQAERARLAADEATRLAGQGGQMSGGLLELNRAMRRKSGSNIIRGEQALEDMRTGPIKYSPGEVQGAERELRLSRERVEAEGAQAGERAMGLAGAIRSAREGAMLRARDVAAEREILELKERGYELEQLSAEARLAALRQQRELLDVFDRSEEEKESADLRIGAAERELELMRERAGWQRRMDAAYVESARLELSMVEAAMEGRFGEAERLRNELEGRGDDAAQQQSFREKREFMSEEDARKAVAEEQGVRVREREVRANELRRRRGVELERGALLASGDESGVAALDIREDLRAAISEGLKAGLGAEEAVGSATSVLSQRLDAERGGAVVSSLGRIGGGGGVSDPALRVAEQQRELLRQANVYLQQLAQQRGGGGGAAGGNVPDVGDRY